MGHAYWYCRVECHRDPYFFPIPSRIPQGLSQGGSVERVVGHMLELEVHGSIVLYLTDTAINQFLYNSVGSLFDPL